MWLIQFILIVVGLIYIYSKREYYEPNLGWKVVGYYLLGSFSLWLNHFPIPIGFIIYLFMKPEININTKKMAAWFGFIMFFLSAIVKFM